MPSLSRNKPKGRKDNYTSNQYIGSSIEERPLEIRLATALDTETTGPDFNHGCKPFYICALDENAEYYFWKWIVNPYTREPITKGRCVETNYPHPKQRLNHSTAIDQLQDFIDNPNRQFILHNSKFDFRALRSIGVKPPTWDRVDDTLTMSHCLNSKEPHDLKSLAIRYCDIDDWDEVLVERTVKEATKIGRKEGYRIAAEGEPHFPLETGTSVRWYKMDMWLPSSIAHYQDYPSDHPWHTVTEHYGYLDVLRTLSLSILFNQFLKEEELEKQYRSKLASLPASEAMEHRGIGIHYGKARKLAQQFRKDVNRDTKACLELAEGHIENLGSPKQLQKLLFYIWEIEPYTYGKDGPSTGKESLEYFQLTLDPETPQFKFIQLLQRIRTKSKAIDYIRSYLAGSLQIHSGSKNTKTTSVCKVFKTGKLTPNNPKSPTSTTENPFSKWRILYPEFNTTGTDTTRWSSNRPNAQNISKKKEINLRTLFGPLPGRRWYSIDYSNIEMRIFAHACGDQNLIDAFALGGSVHLIFAEAIYPEEYAACKAKGESFKDKYKDTYYQWVKNGNFALIYGASPKKADATYHRQGAYDNLRKRLPLVDQFIQNRSYEARKWGLVETMGGYQLRVPKGEPHKAANYFVQGTAGEIMTRAVAKVHHYLQARNHLLDTDCRITSPEWIDKYHKVVETKQIKEIRLDSGLVMQIHDELDLDCPDDPISDQVAYNVCKLMEEAGNDIGLTTPVEIDVITKDWSTGQDVTTEILCPF